MKSSQEIRSIIQQAFGQWTIVGAKYPRPLPPELAPWYCYVSDSGHSIIALTKQSYEAGEKSWDHVVCAPVKAVLRGYAMLDGFVVVDLPYDSTYGLQAPWDDYEYFGQAELDELSTMPRLSEWPDSFFTFKDTICAQTFRDFRFQGPWPTELWSVVVHQNLKRYDVYRLSILLAICELLVGWTLQTAERGGKELSGEQNILADIPPDFGQQGLCQVRLVATRRVAYVQSIIAIDEPS